MTPAEAIAVVRKSLSDLAYDRGYSDEQIAGNEMPALAALALIEQRMEELETFRLRGNARRLMEAERERDSLMADSWRAYVESGADPDGDLKWHCTPVQAGVSLIDAVQSLRQDYDEALSEVQAAEARIAQLEETLREIAEFHPVASLWADQGRVDRVRAALASGKEEA